MTTSTSAGMDASASTSASSRFEEHVKLLRGDTDNQVAVPKSFLAKSGSTLLPGILVGRPLGQGLQGAVFELTDDEGQPLGWVLKAVTAGPAAVFKCLFPGIVREWLVGQELCAALDEQHLSGFMRTGAAIVAQGSGAMLGIVIEQMSGQTLDKLLLSSADGSPDILLIQAMLRQVFTALAGAQQEIGFRHWDLRLANVMQHSLAAHFRAPPLPTDGPSHRHTATQTDSAQPSDVCYKLIDFGHGTLHDRYLRQTGIDAGRRQSPKLPGIPLTEHGYRWFWHREGDVFRLLMSLQNVIDGCCWPARHAPLVQHLAGLIRHVTGVRIKVRLQDGDNSSHKTTCMPWQRQGGCCHLMRQLSIRTTSFWFPSTPRLTAAEALAHPFFVLGPAPQSHQPSSLHAG